MNEKASIQSIRDKLCQAPNAEPDTGFIKLLFDRYEAVNGLARTRETEYARELPDQLFKDGPEVIGRLYQLYMTPEKDEAFGLLSRGGRLKGRGLIPATQIFTPKWIARYMAENGVGRAARDSGVLDESAFARLKTKWRYYIDDADATEIKSATGRGLESLKVIDPCAGSGNLLLSAFDVLREVYVEAGYGKAEAARSIIENNLFGLDIDKNALSIAAFAIWAKARENGCDIASPQDIPNLICLDASDGIGSLGRYGKGLDRKYDAVLANPPYMGYSNLPAGLSDYITREYPDGKADLFAAFIIKCRELTRYGGYTAMITPHAWMFLKSFDEIRRDILSGEIVNMLHLGSRAFEEISGEVVQTAAFVTRARPYQGGKSVYARLVEPRSSEAKEELFLSGKERFTVDQDQFSFIPGFPIAYWASSASVAAFDNAPLRDFALPCQGLATGDNGRFMRLWHEVPREDVCFDADSRAAALQSGKRWFPYNKGGKYRKWYGNDDYVVDWSNDGYGIRNSLTPSGRLKSRPQNMDRFFLPSVTWSKVSSNDIAFRYKPEGFVFDVSGTSMFAHGDMLFYLLAFCNSAVALEISRIVSPTMNFEVGHIARFPVIIDGSKPEIEALAKECVELSREDWDDFENSWNFTVHPMLANKITGGLSDGKTYAETSYGLWKMRTLERALHLKSIEEEINRRFIAMYGFKDVKCGVDMDNVTVRRVTDDTGVRKTRFILDRRDAVASLISYAVGCAYGRFTPFDDGFGDPGAIIAITPAPAANDAVSVLKDFLIRAYSRETLDENMRFIALSLSNGKDACEKVVFAYFYKCFYDDHLKTYRNRPIYWLFDDGEFKALVYAFGFDVNTVRRVKKLRESNSIANDAYSAALDKASQLPAADFSDGIEAHRTLLKEIRSDLIR